MLAVHMVRRAAEARRSPSAASLALARNTAQFRRRMGFSQEKMAELADLPRKTVFNTEKYGNGETRTVEKLAGVFGVSVATMYEDDAETADVQFLAAQIDRLSVRELETLKRVSRALAGRAADDKIRPR